MPVNGRRPQYRQSNRTSQSVPEVAATADGAVSGSEPPLTWYRVDLHIHTPASIDYQEPAVSFLDILRKAEERELDVIAFTDHNSVRGYADLWREIEDLELLEYLDRQTDEERERLADYRRLLRKVLLLPGFEFTATFGFHILAIFPEGTSIRKMEHLLLLLRVPEEKFGSGEVGATTDVLRAYEILDDHGALVIGAHVNSTHGIAMQGFPFGGQTKIAYTQNEHLHALEVTDLRISGHRRSTARFFDGSKPEYPRRMHCIQGSDAHRLDRDPKRETNLGVGDRVTEMLLPSASFQAIRDALRGNAFDRTRPYFPIVSPADEVRAAREQGNTATQAFHERHATKRDGTNHVLRDIAGLANAAGGAVYIGVSPHLRRPVAGVENPTAAIAELQASVGADLQPALAVDIESVPVDGKDVLVVRVPAGAQKPYALPSGAILIRDQDSTRTASRDEIVEMVLAARAAAPVRETAAPVPPRDLTPEPDGGRPRRGRRRRQAPSPRAATVEVQPVNGHAPAAVQETILPDATTSPVEPAAPAPPTAEWTEEDAGDEIAPSSGIEVLDSVVIDGRSLYTLRDLRHKTIVHNVSPETSRKAWRYAIEQHEQQAPDPARVRWKGDLGFWKTYTPRGGDRRFNLVYRDGDTLRIFYAVTLEGLDPRWREVIPAGRTGDKAPAAREPSNLR